MVGSLIDGWLGPLHNWPTLLYYYFTLLYCGTAKFCYKQFVVHHTITLYGFSTMLYQNVTYVMSEATRPV